MKNCIKKNKKGFTLVELIVVLVILGILITVFIPTLTGYIDKAKQTEFMAKAHDAINAAQCVVLEEYATGRSFDTWRGFSNITDGNKSIQDKIYELSGIDKKEFVIANVDVNANGKLIFVNFYSKKTINGQPNRLVYTNGTIGGKAYDGEFILSCWNGVVYYGYKTLDPAQVGYTKDK